jgi:hypothetical protein
VAQRYGGSRCIQHLPQWPKPVACCQCALCLYVVLLLPACFQAARGWATNSMAAGAASQALALQHLH